MQSTYIQSIDHLSMYIVICFKCYNYGHIYTVICAMHAYCIRAMPVLLLSCESHMTLVPVDWGMAAS